MLRSTNFSIGEAEPLGSNSLPLRTAGSIFSDILIIPPAPKHKSSVNKPNAEYEKQRDWMEQKLQIIFVGKTEKSPRAQVTQPNQRAANEKK
jgi:hypothetical protein